MPLFMRKKFKLSENQLRSFITWLKAWKYRQMICIIPPTMNKIGQGHIGGLTTNKNIQENLRNNK